MNAIAQGVVQRALVLAVFTLPLTTEAASWVTNSPMTVARQHHTATLLPNGKVLVAGGDDGSYYPLSSAELYDPATGTWTNTSPMNKARRDHTATLLPNGKVLVAGGGWDVNVQSFGSAELYDPATGAWTNTGSMTINRAWHTAILLSNGKVLVAGGTTGNVNLRTSESYDPITGAWTGTGPFPGGTNLMSDARYFHTATLLRDGKVYVAGSGGGVIKSSADLYDPVLGNWIATGSMQAARCLQTATLLPNGLVLIAGGGQTLGTHNPLASAELYDPLSGTSTLTNSMTAARQWHTATLLPSGKVLVVGGHNGTSATASAEAFDSDTGTWTATATLLNYARHSHTTTLLANGKVLVTGGHNGSTALSSTEIYDSTNGTWKNTGGLKTKRYGHTATLLPNGKALVVGGYDGNMLLSSAELYNLADGSWTNAGSLNTAHQWHTATVLPSGQVLVVAGNGSGGNTELFDPASGTWTNTAALATTRMNYTSTLLPNGKVLVAGGVAFTTNYVELASAELYDPNTRMWRATGSLHIPRESHDAALLSNGKVLIAGGYTFNPTNLTDIYLSSAELYDPGSELWMETSPMTTPRQFHTMTLLPNGTVLVTGGTTNGYNHLSSAELYNPITGTWTVTGQMSTGRVSHTAILLPNGKVLVTGGIGDGNPGYLSTAELYNPATGIWSATATLGTPRTDQTATLLPNGNVLMVGGYATNSALSGAVLYDVGLNFSNSWQPQISTITSPLNLGNNLAITGAQFRGISGASGGNNQDSSSDYPLVQLRSMESGQTMFLQTTNWSTNSFTSLPVWNFPPGWAMATVFVNGIPSTSSIVNISVPVPTAPSITDAKALTNGTFQFDFTNSVGAVFGVLTSTNVSLSLSNWTPLGGVAEISPGQFQFTDPQATNHPQRFYRVRAN